MANKKVQELAETLKKQGLAASMYDATEKAKRIMDAEGKTEEEEVQKESPVKEQQKQPWEKEGFVDVSEIKTPPPSDVKKPVSDEPSVFEKIKDKITPKKEEKFEQPDYNISKEKATVNELMSELGVNPEQVNEIEKEKMGEEVETLKKEIKEADKENEEVKKEKTEQLKEKIGELKEEAEELEEEQ